MKKLFIVLALLFCWSPKADAIVASSNALSYNNVARSPIVRQKVNKPVAIQKDVDLTGISSATVNLAKGDTVVVKLKEHDDCNWEAIYEPADLIFTNKGYSNGIRLFVFKKISQKNNITVYFDRTYKRDDAKCLENKALYIKSN